MRDSSGHEQPAPSAEAPGNDIDIPDREDDDICTKTKINMFVKI
jgi:hypothetical protein